MLWMDGSICIYNSVRCSLIKIPPQGDDHHAQADDNHATADYCKVDLYSIEKDVMKGLLKYVYL